MQNSAQSQERLAENTTAFIQEKPKFVSNDPQVIEDAISLKKEDFIKKYQLLTSGANAGLLTITFNKLNTGVSSKHKPEPKSLSKDECRFIKAIVEVTSSKDLSKAVNQILWLDLIQEAGKFTSNSLVQITRSLAKNNLINMLDDERFSLTDLGVISFDSKKTFEASKKKVKVKKVDLVNFEPEVTTSGRGHYKGLVTKFKPGEVVKFKVPKKDQYVQGTVVESYYRKNSKGPGIYEQVVIKNKGEIFYKTANVLTKYNPLEETTDSE